MKHSNDQSSIMAQLFANALDVNVRNIDTYLNTIVNNGLNLL